MSFRTIVNVSSLLVKVLYTTQSWKEIIFNSLPKFSILYGELVRRNVAVCSPSDSLRLIFGIEILKVVG